MFFNQVGIEAVVTCRHRRVGGEDDLARDSWGRSIESDPLFLHATANRLQHHKPAVSFIQMQHARPNAHSPKCAKSSDPEPEFLSNTCARVTTVQTRCQFSIFWCVSFHVRVE